jgi:hypothetical protein
VPDQLACIDAGGRSANAAVSDRSVSGSVRRVIVAQCGRSGVDSDDSGALVAEYDAWPNTRVSEWKCKVSIGVSSPLHHVYKACSRHGSGAEVGIDSSNQYWLQ